MEHPGLKLRVFAFDLNFLQTKDRKTCFLGPKTRQKWQPGPLAGLPPDRKGDIEVYDFPCAGQSLIIDVTCVSPYSADQTLSHPPDGEPLRSARVAEAGKETSPTNSDLEQIGGKFEQTGVYSSKVGANPTHG